MSTKADLADTIFRGLIARRELLRQGDAAQAVRIIGSRYSSEAMALRAFAIRPARVRGIDLEDADDIEVAREHGPPSERHTSGHHTDRDFRHPTPVSSPSTSASRSPRCLGTCSISS
jgi:hypothetical protein